MSRKDNKNRVLKNGESQRPDGRYVYQYFGLDGKRKSAYSWTLNPSDKVPAGKKVEKSLRELEQEIQKMLQSGISPSDKTTVKDIVLQYCDNAVKGMRDSTKHMYNAIVNHLQVQPFWNLPIIKVDKIQAKRWINTMLEKNNSYNMMCKCKAVLTAAFEMAVDNDILLKNPFAFKMPKQDTIDQQKRVALTPKQKESLLNYCKGNSAYLKWYYVIVILLGTGLRISEFLGLTFSNVDFENNLICVDHQITCYYNTAGMYHNKRESAMRISKPKTANGNRYIAMLPEVRNAFKWLIDNRTKVETKYVLNGVSGFIFLNKNGKPSRAANVDTTFRRIIKSYNKTHEIQLPMVTPHCLRHSFCTDMVQKGMNPKSLQYIMGHATTRMTMDLYAHTNAQSAIGDMWNLG